MNRELTHPRLAGLWKEARMWSRGAIVLVMLMHIGCSMNPEMRYLKDSVELPDSIFRDSAGKLLLTGRIAPISSGPVQVTASVLEGWFFLYRFITETEFVLCLDGIRLDTAVRIEGFYLARMENTSGNSVRYIPCDSLFHVGTAHNHPPVEGSTKDLCYQSEPDSASFRVSERSVVDIVLCGTNKFRWWLKDGRSAKVEPKKPDTPQK